MTFVALSAERLLSHLYETFSVPMTFASPRDESAVSLKAIDRTVGAETAEKGTFIASTRPVAAVRASDLAAINIKARDMEGVTVMLNGKGWRVTTTEPKPGPAGEAAGEVYLVLIARDDA